MHHSLSKISILQCIKYCFPIRFPLHLCNTWAIRIVQERLRSGNMLKEQRKYILFCVALRRNDFRTIEMIHCSLFHWRNTLQNKGYIFGFQLHTGNTVYNEVFCWQHTYRMKEIKSKGNIYLNGRYCRSRLKNEVYMHVWLACCGSIPRLIISFALNGSFVHRHLENEGNIYCFPLCPGLSDFRTIEMIMIHCFLFHSRNMLQKQGDIFDFQLHTGNTLKERRK